MSKPVYLDYNATTPVDPRVLERMLPYFTERFGNPSSRRHAYGWEADEAVETARGQLGSLIGAEPHEILFTSGATEAANLGIKGYAETASRKGRHIVTAATEHKAVLEACRSLGRRGWEVTVLPVDGDGVLSADSVEAALREDTVLVAVMWANNETGVIHPIAEIAERVHARGAAVFSDATQAVGKIPVDAGVVDLLACSGHKLYGPKGVGALFVSRRERRLRIAPQIEGGGQENGLRGGTLNVPGIVGLGAAAAIARDDMASDRARLEPLRDRIEAEVARGFSDLRVNGSAASRLPNTSSMTFPGLSAADLIAGTRDLALSTGSACSSGTGKPSHVLQALGLSDADGAATVRLSIGRFTTDDEAALAALRLTQTASSLATTTPD